VVIGESGSDSLGCWFRIVIEMEAKAFDIARNILGMFKDLKI
jgi:hypothetical protein